MTAREMIGRRMRHAMAVSFASVGAGGVAMIGHKLGHPNVVEAFALLGIVLLVGACVYVQTQIRCPSCRVPIGSISGHLATLPKPLRLNRHRARYCPFCAADFDAEPSSRWSRRVY